MNNLMIDLETLGTSPTAAVVAIGAVFFDPNQGSIGESIYIPIEFKNNPAFGTIDPETVAWWLKQSKTAQENLFSDNAKTSNFACSRLEAFIARHAKQLNSAKLNYWGNGSSFDLVILRQLFLRNGYANQQLWPYWNERDVRTVVDLARTITGNCPKKATPFEGTAHNALHDARHQARYVNAAYQLLFKANATV